MNINILSTIASALPAILNLGYAAAPLIQLALDKVPTTADTTQDAFSRKALQALPAALNAGIDVASVVQHTADALQAMKTDDRGPTDAEWLAQEQAIEALEKQWKDASAAP